MAKRLEWEESGYRDGKAFWARPEPELWYCLDVFNHGQEICLNVTAERETILFEQVASLADGRDKAQAHYDSVRD
jgi:hypothetical protein